MSRATNQLFTFPRIIFLLNTMILMFSFIPILRLIWRNIGIKENKTIMVFISNQCIDAITAISRDPFLLLHWKSM